jgi:hypothetical protein
MGVEMADINKFSEQVIDLAERLADVADAAQGKGNRKSGVGARWLILPAAGAGLYALGASSSFTRRAKTVVNQAKARASELPDDLLSRVQHSTGTTANRPKNGRRPATKSANRGGRQRRSTTSSAR